jgi:hypothetical protein
MNKLTVSQWMSILGGLAAVCGVLGPQLEAMGPKWEPAGNIIAIVGLVVVALNQSLRSTRSEPSDIVPAVTVVVSPEVTPAVEPTKDKE